MLGWFFFLVRLWMDVYVGLVKISFFVCVVLFLEFSCFFEFYSFYFVLLFFCVVICVGYVVVGIICLIVYELGEFVVKCVFLYVIGFIVIFFLWGSCVLLVCEINWIFLVCGFKLEWLLGKGVNSEFLRSGTWCFYLWIESVVFMLVFSLVVWVFFW